MLEATHYVLPPPTMQSAKSLDGAMVAAAAAPPIDGVVDNNGDIGGNITYVPDEL